MSTTYIMPTETAKLIRTALKNAFPGVKFSVRKGTGTASAWINVRWTDGPVTNDVDAILDTFEKDNNKYLLSGILSSREISEEAYQNIYAQIAKNNPTVAVLDAEGKPNKNLNPDFVEDLYVSTFKIRGALSLHNVGSQIAGQSANPAELTYS